MSLSLNHEGTKHVVCMHDMILTSVDWEHTHTPTGPEMVSFVADNGQELFSHSYHSIVQCCIAVDGISFAYICRNIEDNKYYCHVFQALTYEEVVTVNGSVPIAMSMLSTYVAGVFE